ncbi:hypothetical protein C4901_06000 [Acidiferrobacter sp. SPIII_3]|nr:hypothetical protein C4901_06000 [Acidiferrobacter sp. SPIII_3]
MDQQVLVLVAECQLALGARRFRGCLQFGSLRLHDLDARAGDAGLAHLSADRPVGEAIGVDRGLAAFAALAVATIFVRGAASAAGGRGAATVMGGGLTAYSDTVYYLAPFALGALLACHRDAVKRHYLALSSWRRLVLGALAFALYFYGSRTLAALGDHRMLVHDWPTMMGAALGLVVIAYEPAVKALLDHRLFQYLGRISYSLYLFHPLVLLAALHLFYGRISLAPLLAGTFVASIDGRYRLPLAGTTGRAHGAGLGRG